jgi:hypothetical protein
MVSKLGSGEQFLWWRVGTCGSGETKQFLKMTSNLRDYQDG